MYLKITESKHVFKLGLSCTKTNDQIAVEIPYFSVDRQQQVVELSGL